MPGRLPLRDARKDEAEGLDLEPVAVGCFRLLVAQDAAVEDRPELGAEVADEDTPVALFDRRVEAADPVAVGAELASLVAADQEPRDAELDGLPLRLTDLDDQLDTERSGRGRRRRLAPVRGRSRRLGDRRRPRPEALQGELLVREDLDVP